MSTATLSLAGIKTAKPREKQKVEKPPLPDPTGQLAKTAEQAIAAAREIDAAKGRLDACKGALCQAATSYAWLALAGRSHIEDTFMVRATNGTALVTLKNKYKMPTDEAALAQIKTMVPASYLRNEVTLSIDLTEIPADLQQKLVDGLVNVASNLDELYGGGSCMAAISAKPVLVVTKAFHEERHTILNPEDNARLHQLMPCEVAVKLDH